MKIYHGTILQYAVDIYNNGVNLNRSKNFLDFGKGFYTTPDIEMAKDMANRVCAFEKRIKRCHNIFPAIISFDYKEDIKLNYKNFEKEDIEWAKFIMANRLFPEIANQLGLLDNNYDFKYDIIIGGIADGNVASIASNLRFRKLSPKDYNLQLCDFLKKDGSSYGTQIVFCTQRALSCIKYISCDII